MTVVFLNPKMITPFVHLGVGRLLFLTAVIAGIFTPLSSFACIGGERSTARRSVDASNLRQIMMASALYATEHNDQHPSASEVWDYARILADEAGLDLAQMWQSSLDPAADSDLNSAQKVLLSDPRAKPRQLDPGVS